MSDQYPTGTYVKNGHKRVAKNSAQAVALSFEGYKLEEAVKRAAPKTAAKPVEVAQVDETAPDLQAAPEEAPEAESAPVVEDDKPDNSATPATPSPKALDKRAKKDDQ